MHSELYLFLSGRLFSMKAYGIIFAAGFLIGAVAAVMSK